MKTYVKIYGPPLMEALSELQKIASEMPKVTHFHFMTGLPGLPTEPVYGEAATPAAVIREHAEKVTHPLISKSGHTLGDYDFFFEWEHDPIWNETRDLISKIDRAFSRLGCKYTLTTK